jgi:hypothetical protein
LLGCQQFVQLADGLDVVEVVDPLAAFVPEPAKLLEANGASHGR